MAAENETPKNSDVTGMAVRYPEGMKLGPGTPHLGPGEPHPAAYEAMRYMRSLSLEQQMMLMDGFSSTAIEGNRLGEICAETLRRVMHGEPVSDRYIMGLVLTVKSILGN